MTVYDLTGKVAVGDDGGRRRRGRIKMFAVLAVCAAPVIASYLAFFLATPDARSNYGALITPTRSLPNATVRDLAGRSVALRSLQGQWLLVVVGGGECPRRCEDLLYAQRQLREMLGRDRDRLDKVWLVTDDQAIRPAVLAAVQAEPQVMVLRWPLEAVSRWLAPDSGQALDAHLYLVDPMGEWMMRFPVAFDPTRVKRDLERLMRASASWDRAGR